MLLIRLRCLLALCALFALSLAQPIYSEELALDGQTRAELDAWELNRLDAADKAWDRAQDKSKGRKGDRELFTAANAAYQSFIEEFPRSPAVAYALFRQARSFHMDNKRDSARQLYQDIIEFFPDQALFATAALWYQGLSHKEDGNNDDAIRTWSLIAKDKGYRVQTIAADALLELGRYLIKVKRYPEAIEYLSEMAKDFRTRNEEAARDAISLVVDHLVRRTREENKLRDFYISVRGFGSRPIRDFAIRESSQLQDERSYWKEVMDQVNDRGRFSEDELAERKLYWSTWAQRLTDRWQDWDEYRLNRLDWQLNAGGDKDQWVKAVRAQYDSKRGSGGNDRVRDFLLHFAKQPDQLLAIFSDLDWNSMNGRETRETVYFAFKKLGSDDLGYRAVASIPDDKLNDEELAQLANGILNRRDSKAKPTAQGIAQRIKEEELQAITQLRILERHGRDEVEKFLAIAKSLHASERFGAEAREKSAEVLMGAKRYEEAISEWRAWGKDPDYRYRVAECYVRSGDFRQAAGELEIVERSFTDRNRAKAALLQAEVWSTAKDAKKRDEVLVRILREYRGTPEHSKAHDWREKLGDAYVGSRDND